MDLPSSLTKEKFDYLIDQLARRPNAFIEIQAECNKVFSGSLSGETLQWVKSNYKSEIDSKRLEIFEDVNSIPISHSFSILAIAQMRIEHLMKNPKTIRQNRKFDESSGREYFENEEYVDDKALQDWAKIAQNERFNTLKIEIEKIVKFAEQKDKLPPRASGFRPITINTGFDVEEDGKEEHTNSD